jgi:excisionase family DNA binding protein
MDASHDHAAPGRDFLLIAAAEVAKLLQISKRTLARLQSKGAIPPPVRLGGSVRWRLEEIQKWIADGCPVVRARENVGTKK